MRAIINSSKAKSNKKHILNAGAYLASGCVASKIVEYQRSGKTYSQGEPASSVMYIRKGGIKLSVVNAVGKEAVVAMLGPGDFFGEGCLAGQLVRIGMATTITATTLLVIEKKEMLRALHTEPAFSDRFVTYLISRNIRIEQDLIDQLFNSSEKRLARTFLLLTRYGMQDEPETMLP